MNILDMLDKIAVISYLVFPEPALPDRLLPLVQMSSRSQAFEFIPASATEAAFDLTPTHGEVAVIFRQRPNTVQMVG